MIVELIMPGHPDAPDDSVTMDIGMLALFGSRERTEPEYRALLEYSGFVLESVVSTPTGLSIMTATSSTTAG